MSIKELEKIESKEKKEENKSLILFNDNVNSFQWVILSLVQVCGHGMTQAEQCAYIAHYKGKCKIKSGTFEDLEPYYNTLLKRGINVEIQ